MGLHRKPEESPGVRNLCETGSPGFWQTWLRCRAVSGGELREAERRNRFSEEQDRRDPKYPRSADLEHEDANRDDDEPRDRRDDGEAGIEASEILARLGELRNDRSTGDAVELG